eukprot:gb/GECG01015736.1/.p1 GENE.gb/GECG01015736.1/~~gb/GECG01015736.1/.p1  ORF type:complete len:392 (+),score=54.86 gb/GECG01015736.1/:1-1176(+)
MSYNNNRRQWGGGGQGGDKKATAASVVQNPSQAFSNTLGYSAGETGGSSGKKIDRVYLDGLAVMKIIKHCSESLPTFVAGSLLGLDVDNRLEVTHCFPFPSSNSSSDKDDVDPQMDMLKALRDVNVDNNQVGWYQSTYLGSYCNKDLIITQYEFQEHLGPNSVAIVYDPVRSSSGTLSIKALRLTDTFMSAYKDKRITVEDAAKVPLTSGTIFEEIPVRIHNPALLQALMADLESKEKSKEISGAVNYATTSLSSREVGKSILNTDVDRLDLSATPFLEKNLQFLSDQIEDLAGAQTANTSHERDIMHQKAQQEDFIAARQELNKQRHQEGLPPLPLEDPNEPCFRPLQESGHQRLEVLLMSAQVSNYCSQINQFAGQSFGKLFLAGGFHK